MTDTSILNAVITSADLRFDNGFALTAWLHLDFGGTGQGFGGYGLGGTPDTTLGRHNEQPNVCAEFIVGCLRAAGVDQWGSLKGKSIRVEVEKPGLAQNILGIGHIIKDDCWFHPKAAFEALKKNQKEFQ